MPHARSCVPAEADEAGQEEDTPATTRSPHPGVESHREGATPSTERPHFRNAREREVNMTSLTALPCPDLVPHPTQATPATRVTRLLQAVFVLVLPVLPSRPIKHHTTQHVTATPP